MTTPKTARELIEHLLWAESKGTQDDFETAEELFLERARKSFELALVALESVRDDSGVTSVTLDTRVKVRRALAAMDGKETI